MEKSKNYHVVVYTWTVCPYCVRAKRLLSQKGIEFEERNIDGDDEELKRLQNLTHFRTIPQIFINDEFIGGFQELSALDASGELEKKLKTFKK